MSGMNIQLGQKEVIRCNIYNLPADATRVFQNALNTNCLESISTIFYTKSLSRMLQKDRGR